MATYNFKPVIYDGKTYSEATGHCILKSVSENTLKNANQTDYRLANVEFEDANGKPVIYSAMVYENNYVNPETGEVRMEVGESYLMTIRITPDRPKEPLIFVSHLKQLANRASAEVFGFTGFEVPAEKLETSVPASAIGEKVF